MRARKGADGSRKGAVPCQKESHSEPHREPMRVSERARASQIESRWEPNREPLRTSQGVNERQNGAVPAKKGAKESQSGAVPARKRAKESHLERYCLPKREPQRGRRRCACQKESH